MTEEIARDVELTVKPGQFANFLTLTGEMVQTTRAEKGVLSYQRFVTSEPEFAWARLVPELLVTDINKSLRFWRDLCGFAVLFNRPDEGFAYLDLGGAQIMLVDRI